MPRPRSSSRDIRCTDCGSNCMCKNELANYRQAYSCGDCQRGPAPYGAYRRLGKALAAQG